MATSMALVTDLSDPIIDLTSLAGTKFFLDLLYSNDVNERGRLVSFSLVHTNFMKLATQD
jgi:hypothetical protein